MKTPEEMIGATVFTGAPKEDWDRIPLWMRDVAIKVKLTETLCQACGEVMLVETANYDEAKVHPKAVIACLRCVCKAKGIDYPDPGSPKFAGPVQ